MAKILKCELFKSYLAEISLFDTKANIQWEEIYGNVIQAPFLQMFSNICTLNAIDNVIIMANRTTKYIMLYFKVRY